MPTEPAPFCTFRRSDSGSAAAVGSGCPRIPHARQPKIATWTAAATSEHTHSAQTRSQSSCQRGSWLAPPLCWASAGQTGRRRAPDGLARARHVAHEPEGRAGGHLHRESSPLSSTSPLWCGLLLRVGLSLCAGGRPDGCGAALCPPGLLLLERVRRPAQPRQPPAPRPAAAPRSERAAAKDDARRS